MAGHLVGFFSSVLMPFLHHLCVVWTGFGNRHRIICGRCRFFLLVFVLARNLGLGKPVSRPQAVVKRIPTSRHGPVGGCELPSFHGCYKVDRVEG